jgi:hypothetical protein
MDDQGRSQRSGASNAIANDPKQATAERVTSPEDLMRQHGIPGANPMTKILGEANSCG